MKDFEQWVIRAQNGDEKAFEQLVRGFQDKAFAVALTHLGNRYQAEDAFHRGYLARHCQVEVHCVAR